MTGVLIKEMKRHEMLINRQKATWRHNEKAAISKPRREVLGENQFAKTLIWTYSLTLQSVIFCLHTHTHTHTHIHTHTHTYIRTYRLPRWLSGKKSTWQAGEMGLIPGLGRWPGDGNGKPKYSCLGNPMDRGAWWAIVLGVPKELDMT